MIITLFYFSGTGNTHYICQRFKQEMESRQNSVSLFNIDKIQSDKSETINQLINHSDLIGLAYPVYGANLPKIMNDFIDLINIRSEKSAFIISSVGYINAYGPFIIKKKLKRLNIFLKQHLVYYTVNNTKVKKVSQSLLDEKHHKNINKFSQFCRALEENKSFYHGIGPWLIGGYAVRHILKKFIADFYKSLWVNKEKCINCHLCIRNCPENAISFNNEKYLFSENCTTCFRCIRSCPEKAIQASSSQKQTAQSIKRIP